MIVTLHGVYSRSGCILSWCCLRLVLCLNDSRQNSQWYGYNKTQEMKTPECWCALPRCALFVSILAWKTFDHSLHIHILTLLTYNVWLHVMWRHVTLWRYGMTSHDIVTSWCDIIWRPFGMTECTNINPSETLDITFLNLATLTFDLWPWPANSDRYTHMDGTDSIPSTSYAGGRGKCWATCPCHVKTAESFLLLVWHWLMNWPLLSSKIICSSHGARLSFGNIEHSYLGDNNINIPGIKSWLTATTRLSAKAPRLQTQTNIWAL